MVHVPCGGSDLTVWDRTGQDNVFQCLEYLERMRLEDLRRGRSTGWRLAANYSVEVVNPRTGRASTVQVENVGQELHTVYTTLRKQKRKHKRFRKLMDVRREAVLCAVHSSLLKQARLHLTESLNTEFLNSQFEVPFSVHQVRCGCAWCLRWCSRCRRALPPLCGVGSMLTQAVGACCQWVAMRDLFEEMNVSHSGVIDVGELLRWATRKQSSCTVSSYQFLFLELVKVRGVARTPPSPTGVEAQKHKLTLSLPPPPHTPNSLHNRAE